jgi:hypothetical protein
MEKSSAKRFRIVVAISAVISIVLFTILRIKMAQVVRKRYERRRESGKEWYRSYHLRPSTRRRIEGSVEKIVPPYEWPQFIEHSEWCELMEWYSTQVGLAIDKRLYVMDAVLVYNQDWFDWFVDAYDDTHYFSAIWADRVEIFNRPGMLKYSSERSRNFPCVLFCLSPRPNLFYH